jgi:tRNA dimethylallyltransferase
VAIEVAGTLGDVEILTVDSMQVYRGMDIGTAKPTLEERAGVPHHLIDLADPEEEWTLTRWCEAATAALAGVEARGRRALLVGGSGLYVRALVDGLQPPGRYPEVAANLADEVDTTALHDRLRELDPLAASRIEPSNRRRVLRALEVTLGSGEAFSASGPGLGTYPPTPWRMAGLWVPRSVGSRRIAERFTAMLQAGLLDEVRRLSERPAGLSRTARQALGYRELLAHLEGRAGYEDAVDEAVRRTRAFARRQRVWWRRDPRIRWWGSTEDPLAVIPFLLGDWSSP